MEEKIYTKHEMWICKIHHFEIYNMEIMTYRKAAICKEVAAKLYKL